MINLSLEFDSSVRAPRSPTVGRSATRAGAASSWWPPPATRPTRGGLPGRASRDRRGRHHRNGCEADYSNAGDDLDVVAPGGGVDAPNSDNAWDAQHCRPDRRPPHLPADLHREHAALRPPRRLGGHLDVGPARVGHRGAA